MKQNTLDINSSNNLKISIFISVTPFVLGAAYYLARLGFENNSLLLVAKTVGLAYFLIFLPEFAGLLKRKFRTPDFWYNSNSFVFLLGFFLVVFLGLISSLINLIIPVVLAGYYFWVLSLNVFTRNNNRLSVFFTILFGLIFSFVAVGSAWDGGYHNPLFFEKVILGVANIDTTFHASVVNMIKQYGIPSTGLHGLPYLQYHWGSHYFFAQISKLLSIDALTFYNLASPVVVISFLFRSFFFFVGEFQKYFKIHKEIGWPYWVLVVVVFAGAIPLKLFSGMQITFLNLMTSESMLMALALTFLLFSIAIVYFKDPKYSAWFLFLLVPIMLVVIGMTKISLLYLLLAIISYLFLRLKIYVNKKNILFFLLCLIIAVAVLIAGNDGEGAQVYLFHYILKSTDPDTKVFFPFYYFLWVWIYIYLRFYTLKVRTIREAVQTLKKKKVLELEVLIIMSIVGMIPGLFLAIPGGSAGNFSVCQKWFALALILAILPSVVTLHRIIIKKSLLNMRWVAIPIVLLALAFSYYFLKNTTSVVFDVVRENITIRYRLLAENSSIRKNGIVKEIPRLVREDGLGSVEALLAVASESQQGLEKKDGYQMFDFLRKQSTTPTDGKVIIFIPQESVNYWSSMPYDTVPFLTPALSGKAMIYGIHPYVPTELSEEGTTEIIKQLKIARSDLIGPIYIPPTENISTKSRPPLYVLKGGISENEKNVAYDLLSPYYYSRLKNYGYRAYDFPTQEEYLRDTSTDEALCRTVRDRGFEKVIIIDSGENNEITKRELDCRDS